jgi:O-succinylbenzoic acid--CoA ligase
MNDEAYIEAKTSGSTGTPKSVRLSKKAMIASALHTNRFLGLRENDKALLCLSTRYIAGKMMVVRAIVGGLNLIAVPPVALPEWDDSIAFTAMSPMQVQALLATQEGRSRFCKIGKVLIGGSPLPESLGKELSLLPPDCYMTYGMTETVSHVALSRIEEGQTSERIYHALPEVTFTIDNRNCLVIHAPHLQEAPFVTNDVVKLFSETSFVWLGRWDHAINSGGIKLFPEEIERKLASLIDVRFYITALPHELLGQQVVLKVEGEAWTDSQQARFWQQVKSCLSKYELPKQIIFVEKFEETATGKVKRE